MNIKIIVLTLVTLLAVSASPILAIEEGSTPSAGKRERVGQVKMKVCEAKQESIQKRMDQLTQLATNMQGKFATHTQRVMNYYTEKILPSGKTVANYDTLVADIEAKNTAVSENLAKAQLTANSFTCEAENPRQILTSFRIDMQKTKAALKEYRTSIKNLIVAVRGVAKTVESPAPTTIPVE